MGVYRRWSVLGKEGEEMTNAEIMVDYCEAQLGAPYVFGARGQKCTPSYRRSAASGAHPTIISKCQVLTGRKSSCAGCAFNGKLCFDCRGLTYCAAKYVGLRLQGAGATSQWNDAANWNEKGAISEMPISEICIVMRAKGSKMEHTALYCGDGTTIEASVNVRRRPLSAGKWTHYGRLPKMDDEGGTGMQATVKYGSSGDSVTELQNALNKLGYAMSVDGKLGNETLAALKSYQATNGLEVDGVCGAVTWATINKALNDGAPQTEPKLTLEERVKALEAKVDALEAK